jgi:hypothetical protein
MSKKDPRFRPNLAEPCPCGSGKILARCCYRIDGTIRKERSSIRPPGPSTGYSHPRCYLNFTQNCSSKITGEHLVSRGILKQIGQEVEVAGVPWLKPGEIQKYRINNLTANILCNRHNSAFSGVDAAASTVFRLLNDVNIELSKKSLSRRKRYYLVSGEDLEMWAAKALLGLFHSQPRDTVLAGYTVDFTIVETLIKTSRLPSGCGLYLNRQLGTRRVHRMKEITIGTITNPVERTLIGITIDIVGVLFDFFLESRGINFQHETKGKLYRPSNITFAGRGRSHVIFFTWPPASSQIGIVFSMNKAIFP